MALDSSQDIPSVHRIRVDWGYRPYLVTGRFHRHITNAEEVMTAPQIVSRETTVSHYMDSSNAMEGRTSRKRKTLRQAADLLR